MYKSLQAGRALAAILVVLYHLGGAIAAEKYFGINSFSVPFSFGISGVAFFFILSGFIILTAHRNDISKPNRLGRYFWKRMVRIYPTYWIIFFLVFGLAVFSHQIDPKVSRDFLLILKSLVLLPQNAKTVGGTGAPVLGVAWTLQYEMLFYFSFSFLIINKYFSIIILGGGIYLYLILLPEQLNVFPFSFIYKDYTFLFVMGMIVSIICQSGKLDSYRCYRYLFLGVLLFATTAIDTIVDTNFLEENKVILYGLASSLIVLGLVEVEKTGKVFGGHKLLQLLGDSSYALYLIHYPIISVLCKLAVLLQFNQFGIFGALISYVCIFCICLLSGVIFHVFLERPVVNFLRNLGLKNKNKQVTQRIL